MLLEGVASYVINLNEEENVQHHNQDHKSELATNRSLTCTSTVVERQRMHLKKDTIFLKIALLLI